MYITKLYLDNVLQLHFFLNYIPLTQYIQKVIKISREKMSLPPEHINIKRRREEEPVETLCAYFFFSPFMLFSSEIGVGGNRTIILLKK